MYPAIYYEVPSYDDELYHHGVKGMRWGVRKYQNADGTLTAEGRRRYYTVEGFNKVADAHEQKLEKQRALNQEKERLSLAKQYVSGKSEIAKQKEQVQKAKQEYKQAKKTAKFVDKLIRDNYGMSDVDAAVAAYKESAQAKQDLKKARQVLKANKNYENAVAYANARNNADIAKKELDYKKDEVKSASKKEYIKYLRNESMNKYSKEVNENVLKYVDLMSTEQLKDINMRAQYVKQIKQNIHDTKQIGAKPKESALSKADKAATIAEKVADAADRASNAAATNAARKAADKAAAKAAKKEQARAEKQAKRAAEKVARREAKRTAKEVAKSNEAASGKSAADDFWKKLAENDRRLAGASPRR